MPTLVYVYCNYWSFLISSRNRSTARGAWAPLVGAWLAHCILRTTTETSTFPGCMMHCTLDNVKAGVDGRPMGVLPRHLFQPMHSHSFLPHLWWVLVLDVWGVAPCHCFCFRASDDDSIGSGRAFLHESIGSGRISGNKLPFQRKDSIDYPIGTAGDGSYFHSTSLGCASIAPSADVADVVRVRRSLELRAGRASND